MEKAIEVVGNIAAVLGILACLVSGVFNLMGHHRVFDGTLVESVFLFGVGLMVTACLAKLHLLSSRK